jgi:type II secretory pathway component GspD/PulD (secretin)
MIFFSSYTLADTAIIPLNNNTAENILPTVQNLVEPGGSVSAFQGKLIIKSSAQNIADIKNVLASIDKPARQLFISVRQDGAGRQSNKNYDVNGQIQVNPNVTITHNSDGTITERTTSQTSVGIGSVNINANNRNSRTIDDASQRISAMEGYPARITIGQQVPIVSTSRNYRDKEYNRSVEYQDVNQGFYVTAHLFGDNQVQIELTTENDKLNAHDRNTIDTQHASTTVSGNLGQWLSVGGISQSGTQNENGMLSQDDRFKQLNNSIYIKVDVVP